MKTLYKKEIDSFLFFKIWKQDNDIARICYGSVGEQGVTEKLRYSPAIIKQETKKYQNNGYKPINFNDMYILVVEYIVNGFGTPGDLNKRYKLQDLLSDVFWWNGLGTIDGGDIGNNTMCVYCYVVDFNLAKKVIEEELKDTEFADYSRIYEEEK